MDVSSIPIMAALKKRMHWLNSNQAVLSENISNADTPGYSAKRLEKQDFSSLVNGMGNGGTDRAAASQLKKSNGKHFSAGGGAAADFPVKSAKNGEKSLSGNSVVLEDEMIKLADNQMEHGMVVNLYKKNMQLLKIAMGKGRGR